MTHPLIDALKDYLNETRPTCPECGSTVFDVSLEKPQYEVNLEAETVDEDSTVDSVPTISSVECHQCREAL